MFSPSPPKREKGDKISSYPFSPSGEKRMGEPQVVKYSNPLR
jgi:hypothetical protein